MNDPYSIFKKFSYDNHYVSFTKVLNSAHTTKEAQQSMPPARTSVTSCAFIYITPGCQVDGKRHTLSYVKYDTVATIYGCGSYHSFYVYEGRIYFVCTYKGTLRFGELKLKQYDTEKVNDKLIELFGE